MLLSGSLSASCQSSEPWWPPSSPDSVPPPWRWPPSSPGSVVVEPLSSPGSVVVEPLSSPGSVAVDPLSSPGSVAVEPLSSPGSVVVAEVLVDAVLVDAVLVESSWCLPWPPWSSPGSASRWLWLCDTESLACPANAAVPAKPKARGEAMSAAVVAAIAMRFIGCSLRGGFRLVRHLSLPPSRVHHRTMVLAPLDDPRPPPLRRGLPVRQTESCRRRQEEPDGHSRLPRPAQERRSSTAARPVRRRAGLAGSHGRGDAADRPGTLDDDRRRSGRASHDVDLGRDAPAAAVDVRRGHPLCDDLVEARHVLRRRQRRRAAGRRTAVAGGGVRDGHLNDRLHHQSAARRRTWAEGVGGLDS